ncbi:MAG: hypothetical protein AB1426_12895 [Bacillota bacterium]
MAYLLDWFAVIKAFFVPADCLFYSIMLLAFGIPLILILGQLKRGVPLQRIRPVFALLIAVPVAALLGISVLYTGSGWQLADRQLKLRTIVGSWENIKVEQAQVALEEDTGPWEAKSRINGLGLPGLCVGWFKFKNGKTALYFRHLHSSQQVVLAVGSRYYVIAHPGVEKLYKELLARGAQPAEL